MNRDDSGGGVLLLLGGLIGVLAGIAVGVALLSYAYPVFQSDKWAAWVQAVGSVGAIIAAIFIMREQSKAAEKRDLEYRNQRLVEKNEDVIRLLDHLMETIQSLIAHASVFDVYVLSKGADDRTDYEIAFQVLANSMEIVGLSTSPVEARLNNFILYIRLKAEELASIARKTGVDSMGAQEAKQNIKLILMSLNQGKKTLKKEREHLVARIDSL